VNIGMSPVSTEYFNGQMTAAQVLGIRPGPRGGGAGESLPSTSAAHGAGDNASVWYSPDSPTFWVVAVLGVCVFGMAGADARVRLGRGRAAASVGKV
jgi:hypothetical protein